MQIPAGGPSTINGVVYQMLWSLARCAKLRILNAEKSRRDKITKATLVLEPRHGGDLIIRADRTVVEQVKSRSSARTWSLQEIIKEVLPDLYLGDRLAEQDTQFHFVTDGRMGAWQDVLEFFRSLSSRQLAVEEHMNDLDDSRELQFQRLATRAGRLFWKNGP